MASSRVKFTFFTFPGMNVSLFVLNFRRIYLTSSNLVIKISVLKSFD